MKRRPAPTKNRQKTGLLVHLGVTKQQNITCKNRCVKQAIENLLKTRCNIQPMQLRRSTMLIRSTKTNLFYGVHWGRRIASRMRCCLIRWITETRTSRFWRTSRRKVIKGGNSVRQWSKFWVRVFKNRTIEEILIKSRRRLTLISFCQRNWSRQRRTGDE